MRDTLPKLALLVMTVIALGIAVLYAVHQRRFPIALEICETSTGQCSYTALYRDWESCILASDRSNLYCENADNTEQIFCQRRGNSRPASRCIRQ
jgi:hypothetical protein